MSDNRTYRCAADYINNSTYSGFVGFPLSSLVLCQNIVSIFVICRSPKLHTNTNILIVSVALADLMVSLAFLTNQTVHVIGVNKHIPNVIIADTFLFGASYSSVMLSVNQMGVIAVDRYIYITHPFYYIKHVTKRLILKIIICFWCVALIYQFVPVIVYTGDSIYHRTCILLNPPLDYLYFFTIVYCISCTLIVVFYFKIAVLAFKRKKAANARLQTYEIETVNGIRTNRAAAMRSVKFLSVMCGVYLVCTFPGSFMTVLSSKYTISLYVHTYFQYMFLVHPLLNFVIYIRMNKDFFEALKKTFRDMTCFRKPCCHGNKTNSQLSITRS